MSLCTRESYFTLTYIEDKIKCRYEPQTQNNLWSIVIAGIHKRELFYAFMIIAILGRYMSINCDIWQREVVCGYIITQNIEHERS